MIHLLLVHGDSDREFGPHPGFEVLRARTAEEALEKLARNRRVDAVLFFDERTAAATLRLLSEEDPAPPPLYVAGPAAPPPAVALGDGDPLLTLQEILGD